MTIWEFQVPRRADPSRHHFKQSHDPERKLVSHVVQLRKQLKVSPRAKETLAHREIGKAEQQAILRSAVQNTK